MFVCLYEDCNSRKFVRTAKPFITYPIRGSEPRKQHDISAESLDDHRALEPPDPIPNSVVKRCIADGSVGFPHVRVGHRQAPIPKPPIVKTVGGFTLCREKQTMPSSAFDRQLNRTYGHEQYLRNSRCAL